MEIINEIKNAKYCIFISSFFLFFAHCDKINKQLNILHDDTLESLLNI